MSRPLRIEVPGAIYHVTSRGDGREAIYLDDSDRLRWLDLLGDICERYRWHCHAWCQMGNHYHIVVETEDANLSRGMRQLNGIYTQYFNRAHDRVGHVFQGRYKAILVEREGYLLQLVRYVVLNPVRAGMVALPSAWPWSSYAATTGAVTAQPWLEIEGLLAGFANTRRAAIAGYVDFVHAGMGQASIWKELRGQVYLGGDEFVRSLAADQASIDGDALSEVPRSQRQPIALPLAEYQLSYPDRDSAMAAAYASGSYTLKQIAEAFGVHYATVSRKVRGSGLAK